MRGLRNIGLSVLTLALLFGANEGAAQSRTGHPAERVLYLFLSGEGAGEAEAARRATELVRGLRGSIRLRPVLLMSDFATLRKSDETSALFQTVKALGALGQLDVPVYDEEGLAVAERWGVNRVPTFVLASPSQIHMVTGARVDLGSLLECRE